MKILYINHDNNFNGSTIALKNIIKYFNQYHEIRIITPINKKSEHSEVINFLKESKIKYYPLNYGLTVYPEPRKNLLKWIYSTMAMIYNTIITRYKTRRIIDEFKPNIVHTNNGPIDIALDYCIKKNIPHVWHLREYADLGLGLKIFPSTKYWKKKIKTRGNYNVAITKGVYDYYQLRSCDKVIYDGPLDLSEEKSYSKSNEKYFLFVGSPTQECKGFYDALVAFKEIHSNFPEYKLIAAGPYYEESNYGRKVKEFIIENKLNDKVKLLGYRNDIYELMHKATALLVTSYFEGFGFTTAEAMYCNCLVIGRNTTGTKEQFDNGLLETGKEIALRFNTTEELIKNMQTAILEDNINIIDRAQKTVKSLYNSTTSNKNLEKYYYEILNKTHP